MFEQTFKNIDDTLHKDVGCSSELDYVEQTSWMLFLECHLEAVKRSGGALEYADDSLKADREVVLEAIKNSDGGMLVKGTEVKMAMKNSYTKWALIRLCSRT